MTRKELTEKLQSIPEDEEVFVWDFDTKGLSRIEDAYQDEYGDFIIIPEEI